LQDALVRLLIKKEVITELELSDTFREIQIENQRVKAIAMEPDWIKKFEMCEQYSINTAFLQKHLKQHPQEVSKEVLDTIEKRWPNEG